jgi:hypothetical protein
MAFQSAPNCANAYIQCTNLGKAVGHSLNFYKIDGYSQADIDNLAALVDAWVGGELLPILSTGCAYVATTVRGLTSPVDLTSVNADSAANGSGDAGTQLPVNVSYAVKFTTAFTGRSARGRAYMFGLSAGVTQSGNRNLVTSTWAASALDAWNALIAAALAEGWTWVVLSRFSDNEPRLIPHPYTIEGVGYTDLRLDTRRMRLGG